MAANPLYDGGLHLWVHDTTPITDGIDLINNAAGIPQGLRFSTTCPGGFASMSFQISHDPFTAYDALLVRGNWISLEHTLGGTVTHLWEGKIVDVIPSASEVGLINVECGGLYDYCQNRQDYARTIIDIDPAQWQPTKKNYRNYSVNIEGTLDLRAEKRDAGDGNLPGGQGCSVYYWIDGGLAGADIDHITFNADYDLGSNFTCQVQTSDSPWGTWSDNIGGTHHWTKTNLDETPAGTQTAPPSGSFAAGTRAVRFLLMCDSDAGVSADRFLTVSNVTVYGQATESQTVDTIMHTIADDAVSGLTADTDTLGNPFVEFVARPVGTAAEALDQAANLYSARFDWGFWEDQTFRCKALKNAATTSNFWKWNSKTAPDTWDIHANTEDQADHVCVLYGYDGTTTYPRGTVRALYVPANPAAGDRVHVVDFSDRVLSDTFADDVADQYLLWAKSDVHQGTATTVGYATMGDDSEQPAAYVQASDYIVDANYSATKILITSTEYDVESAVLTVTVGDYRPDFAPQLVTHRISGVPRSQPWTPAHPRTR